MSQDYIVRATAANHQIRAFACTGRETVETAREKHNTSPIATAALGRLLMGGAMMGVMLKGEEDMLTLQIQCQGPIKGLTVTADSKGRVKGYVNEPGVMLPPNAKGKLDVSGALGLGILSVMKDMGLKEPYASQTELKTGEIAEDLTYYFAASEQVPSSVGLGVLMEHNNTVKQAGGFIIQLMPFTDEDVIARLEKKLAEMEPITTLMDRGMNPEEMLEYILGEFEPEIMDKMPMEFACNCSKERIEKAIISLGRKEIQTMIRDGESIEVNCHFCNSHYQLSVGELTELLRKSK